MAKTRRYFITVPPELFGADFLDRLKSFLERSLKTSPVIVRAYTGSDESGLLLIFGDIVAIRVFGDILMVEGKDSEKTRAVFGILKRFIRELAGKRPAGGDIYFVYIPGEDIVPQSLRSPVRRLFQKLFSENMVYLFFVFALLSITIYVVTGPLLTPILVTLLGLLAISAAPGAIPPLISDWRIPGGASVRILRIKISNGLDGSIDKDKLLTLKMRLEPYALQKDLDEEKVTETIRTMLRTGELGVELYSFSVHDYIKSLARKLGLKFRGRVYITNTVVKNALSLGYGRNSAIILTSGVLTALKKDEVKAIIAHELSHIARGDVLLFFALASLEYAFRLYYFFIVSPLSLLDPLFVTAYILFTTILIFMFSKYLEIRADLDAARLGLGLELANALAKVAPSQGYERSLMGRLWEWLRPEPHPPIRYRISYLLSLRKRRCRNSWLTAFFLLAKGVFTVS